MRRLFAPPTRDTLYSRSPLTAASLLVHVLIFAALLVPLERFVSDALRDRQLIYLVPEDRDGGRQKQSDDVASFQTRATPTQGPAPGPAEPVQESDGVIARGETPAPSSAELAAISAPVNKEEVAVTELDVDSTVVRDPTSAAPSYPPSLLTRGITGSASVRYVVDTLGFADTLTYRVLAATHVDFAVAVRRALPDMHFRPAIQRGHKVRQWVEQTFHFRITPRDTARTTIRP